MEQPTIRTTLSPFISTSGHIANVACVTVVRLFVGKLQLYAPFPDENNPGCPTQGDKVKERRTQACKSQ